MVLSSLILELDVDLGAVKRTIAFIQRPFASSAIQSFAQLRLGIIPHLQSPNVIRFGSG